MGTITEIHTEECIEQMQRRRLELEAFLAEWPGYCRTCEGRGFLMWPDDCPDCFAKEQCPRCRAEVIDADEYVCSACGWDLTDWPKHSLPERASCTCGTREALTDVGLLDTPMGLALTGAGVVSSTEDDDGKTT